MTITKRDLFFIGLFVLGAILLIINTAHGQVWKPCVAYDSPALIVVDIIHCQPTQYNSAIAYYVSQGFDIKAATYKTIYL